MLTNLIAQHSPYFDNCLVMKFPKTVISLPLGLYIVMSKKF